MFDIWMSGIRERSNVEATCLLRNTQGKPLKSCQLHKRKHFGLSFQVCVWCKTVTWWQNTVKAGRKSWVGKVQLQQQWKIHIQKKTPLITLKIYSQILYIYRDYLLVTLFILFCYCYWILTFIKHIGAEA